ncbi:MAG: hypothetical protein D6706_16650 [Chloroflexi bacterium]|nr:MAG: hypothetical protein D6706_16650 [Chloroflexota bacterium]
MPPGDFQFGNPELEWRLAAAFCHVPYYDGFLRLPREERAAIVATYRIQKRMEAITEWEKYRKIKRMRRRK